MTSVVDASKNLKRLDAKTSKAVLVLYNEVDTLLKSLIINDKIGLRKAQAMLVTALDKAIVSTDFIPVWKAGVIDTIVASSYVKTTVKREAQIYTSQLLGTSLFPDKVKLSTRIRRNSSSIIREQKAVLKTALSEGRAITETMRKINIGFKGDIQKDLAELSRLKIAGQKIPPAKIRKVEKAVSNLKTEGLKKSYTKLLDVIDVGGNVDKAVANAMVSKTRYLSQRLARSETIRSIGEVKNQRAVDDPNTKYVKNLTNGDDPCPYCVSVSNLGYVPVESAEIATHHPNCSCSPTYKKTSRKVEPWSSKEYTDKLQTEINKANKINKAKGRGITYIKPQKPINLRENTFTDKLDRATPVNVNKFINEV